ncbi:UDP-glucose 4-epimerase GalE [Flaviflexus massiliensis]|uniref:UDP-glucose 4-epimerase GalE n=1 Tax=Flaviflexus massiliensis TaxID=1522309 RepID=UPI0006D58BA6|nr:UDP-glucose 4-epimerase GalE [Flaviflexus massiliensis]
MKVLVTGGAGYIGSHTVAQLIESGHEPVIVDNFSNSSPGVLLRINEITGREIEFHEVDLTDTEKTLQVFQEVQPEAVIHFASHKAVGESVEKPLHYYRNNFDSSLSVVEAMLAVGCRNIIFSSSATVYGDGDVPMQETQEYLRSGSPYGRTKIMIEQMLGDIAEAHPIRVALLRYFNPVGAHHSGLIGEDPLGIPNNLMPYISQVATGRREKLTVFGGDYDTPDGTCLRDYIHVVDLAEGHVKALELIARGDVAVRAWNLGRGEAVSVLELVNAFQEVSGREIPYVIGPRRAGDLPSVWADSSRARDELGWSAERTVVDMCADTWRWQSMNPDGYRAS